MSYLDIVSDANNLFDAFQMAKRGSDWKASTQRCQMNLLRNISQLRRALRDGTYRQMPFFEFVLAERGKVRPIRSQHITDRIVQRSLCDNALIPALSPYLIYDNGASLKNKGVGFARRRLKVHLEKFLRRHPDGYVLLIDFSKFFDNIPHAQLLESVQRRLGGDTSLRPLLEHVVSSFSPDVSYMTDAEYASSAHVPFSSIRHRERQTAYQGPTGRLKLSKSMGIGSQISQIGGVFFPTVIDNYFKCAMGFKYYGRYMDDVYVIHSDRQRLMEALGEFERQATTLGMFVNRKKTQIVRLSHGFTYLKTRYAVVGRRIAARADNSAFVRERRRLKRFRGLFERGQMTRKMVSDAYQSWRGSVLRYAHRRQNLRFTDNLYLRLFYYN